MWKFCFLFCAVFMWLETSALRVSDVPVNILAPTPVDTELEDRLEKLELQLDSLDTEGQNSAVKDASELHSMKKDDEENREAAVEAHEDHLEEVEEDAKIKAEEAEEEKIAAVSEQQLKDEISSSSRATSDMQKDAKENAFSQMRSDREKTAKLSKAEGQVQEDFERSERDLLEKRHGNAIDRADDAAAETAADAESEVEKAEMGEKKAVISVESNESLCHGKSRSGKSHQKAKHKRRSAILESPTPKISDAEARVEAYSVEPCPCLKAQQDLESNCGGTSSAASGCVQNEEDIKHMKEEAHALEKSLAEVEDSQNHSGDGFESGFNEEEPSEQSSHKPEVSLETHEAEEGDEERDEENEEKHDGLSTYFLKSNDGLSKAVLPPKLHAIH